MFLSEIIIIFAEWCIYNTLPRNRPKINTADYEPLIIQNPIEYFKNNPQWLLIDDTIKVVLNDINIEHNE